MVAISRYLFLFKNIDILIFWYIFHIPIFGIFCLLRFWPLTWWKNTLFIFIQKSRYTDILEYFHIPILWDILSFTFSVTTWWKNTKFIFIQKSRYTDILVYFHIHTYVFLRFLRFCVKRERERVSSKIAPKFERLGRKKSCVAQNN